MRFHPLLLGSFFIALGLASYALTLSFPAMPGQRFGPELFPRIMATCIALCGALMAWKGRRHPGPWLERSPVLRGRALVSFLLLPAAVGLYLWAADAVGFLPVAAFLVAGLAWWFGERLWRAALLGLIGAMLVQWFFGQLMRVPLPRGIFMQWVEAAL
jgi:putative tricarboxylic transport membrane protein